MSNSVTKVTDVIFTFTTKKYSSFWNTLRSFMCKMNAWYTLKNRFFNSVIFALFEIVSIATIKEFELQIIGGALWVLCGICGLLSMKHNCSLLLERFFQQHISSFLLMEIKFTLFLTFKVWANFCLNLYLGYLSN